MQCILIISTSSCPPSPASSPCNSLFPSSQAPPAFTSLIYANLMQVALAAVFMIAMGLAIPRKHCFRCSSTSSYSELFFFPVLLYCADMVGVIGSLLRAGGSTVTDSHHLDACMCSQTPICVSLHCKQHCAIRCF